MLTDEEKRILRAYWKIGRCGYQRPERLLGFDGYNPKLLFVNVWPSLVWRHTDNLAGEFKDDDK